MARIITSSSAKEHQQLLEEIRELTSLVQDLSEKLEKLQVSTSEKEASTDPQGEKKEGIFGVGDRIYLKSKSKYGMKGDKGQVEYIGKVFITVRLESGKITTRQPQNLGHRVWARHQHRRQRQHLRRMEIGTPQTLNLQ